MFLNCKSVLYTQSFQLISVRLPVDHPITSKIRTDFKLTFPLQIPITQNLNYHFFTPNFQLPIPTRSLWNLNYFKPLFNSRSRSIKSRFALTYTFQYPIFLKSLIMFKTPFPLPIQIHLKPYLPVNPLFRKELLKSFFPLYTTLHPPPPNNKTWQIKLYFSLIVSLSSNNSQVKIKVSPKKISKKKF
jgi:hypothetical protein